MDLWNWVKGKFEVGLVFRGKELRKNYFSMGPWKNGQMTKLLIWLRLVTAPSAHNEFNIIFWQPGRTNLGCFGNSWQAANKLFCIFRRLKWFAIKQNFVLLLHQALRTKLIPLGEKRENSALVMTKGWIFSRWNGREVNFPLSFSYFF